MSGSRLDARGEKITTFWGIKDRGYDYVSIDLRDNCLRTFEHFGTHAKLLELRLDNNMLESFMGLTRQPSLLVVDLQGNPIAAHPLYRVMVLLAVGFSVTTIDGAPVTTQEYDMARAMGYHAALAVSYGWRLQAGARSQEEYLEIIEECKKARRKPLGQQGVFKTVEHVLEERRESVLIRVPSNQPSVDHSRCFSAIEYERVAERVKHLEELLHEAKKELNDQQQQHMKEELELSRTDSLSGSELRCAHSILFTENIRLTTNVTTSTHEESSGCVQGAIMFERASLVFLTFMSRTRLAEFPLCDLQVEIHQNVLRIRGSHGSISDVFFGDMRTLRCVYKLIYLRRGSDVPLFFMSSAATESVKLLIDASVNTERCSHGDDGTSTNLFFQREEPKDSFVHSRGEPTPCVSAPHGGMMATDTRENKRLPDVSNSPITLIFQDGQTTSMSCIQESFGNTYAEATSLKETTNETDEGVKSEVSQETQVSTNAVTPRLFSDSHPGSAVMGSVSTTGVEVVRSDNCKGQMTANTGVSTLAEATCPAVRALRRPSSTFIPQRLTSARLKASPRTRVVHRERVSMSSVSPKKGLAAAQDPDVFPSTDAATGVLILSKPTPNGANSPLSSRHSLSVASSPAGNMESFNEEPSEDGVAAVGCGEPCSLTPRLDTRSVPKALTSRASAPSGRRSPAVRELRQRPLTVTEHAPAYCQPQLGSSEASAPGDMTVGVTITTETSPAVAGDDPCGSDTTATEHQTLISLPAAGGSNLVVPLHPSVAVATTNTRGPPPSRVPSRRSSVVGGNAASPGGPPALGGSRAIPRVPTTRASTPVGRSSPPARVSCRTESVDVGTGANPQAPARLGKSADVPSVPPMPTSSGAKPVKKETSSATPQRRYSLSGTAYDDVPFNHLQLTDGTGCQFTSPLPTYRAPSKRLSSSTRLTRRARSVAVSDVSTDSRVEGSLGLNTPVLSVSGRSALSTRGSSSGRLSRRWRPTAAGDVAVFNRHAAVIEDPQSSRDTTSMASTPGTGTPSTFALSGGPVPPAPMSGETQEGNTNDIRASLAVNREGLASNSCAFSSSIDYRRFLTEPEPNSDTDESLEGLL